MDRYMSKAAQLQMRYLNPLAADYLESLEYDERIRNINRTIVILAEEACRISTNQGIVGDKIAKMLETLEMAYADSSDRINLAVFQRQLMKRIFWQLAKNEHGQMVPIAGRAREWILKYLLIHHMHLKPQDRMLKMRFFALAYEPDVVKFNLADSDDFDSVPVKRSKQIGINWQVMNGERDIIYNGLKQALLQQELSSIELIRAGVFGILPQNLVVLMKECWASNIGPSYIEEIIADKTKK
jgi:hypothetical protein